ncbi:MAG: response regulator [bacterium]|nr:response regulator [bacterium]
MKRILVVDDEQYVLDGLKRLLREFRDQWQLLFALNGKEALEVTSRGGVDLIITDVRMPEMNGLELLVELKNTADTRNIPVVILTGDQERNLKRQALNLGAVDLLDKPVDKEDLVARIRNVLQIKEYSDIIIEKNTALEKQLVISQKMELVGIMAAGAVHDLSNLLSVIVGYSSLFIKDNVRDKHDSLGMERIKIASEKASALVGQILKFSRQENDFNVIDLGHLVDEILGILEVVVPKGIRVRWDKPDKGIYLMGSPIKLQQVLMNLCINAVQAMGKEGKLSISMDKQNDTVRILVRDNGPGMDEETRENIFMPLFTTKKEGKGTGLGLFVVKHIVEEYKGQIEVQSTPGEGTLFKVSIPLK